MLEALKSETTHNVSGWIGAAIESNKDSVISNGMLNFGVDSNSASRGARIDQIVPESKIGNEYVFVRGYGNNISEFPVMVGTENNTAIYINGATTAIATINNGDYYEISGNNYSRSSVGANMLVTTSENTYAYQVTSGGSAAATVGLNFIAPVNCLLLDTLDNIHNITDMAGINASGDITIVASANTPNSDIIISDNTVIVTTPTETVVTGSSDCKTFYISGLTGNVSVNSTGPIAVGFLGFTGNGGVASYFSEFNITVNTNIELVSSSNCLNTTSFEVIDEIFGLYQWYVNGNIIPGATSDTYTPIETGLFHVEITKGNCTYKSIPLGVFSCSVITNRVLKD